MIINQKVFCPLQVNRLMQCVSTEPKTARLSSTEPTESNNVSVNSSSKMIAIHMLVFLLLLNTVFRTRMTLTYSVMTPSLKKFWRMTVLISLWDCLCHNCLESSACTQVFLSLAPLMRMMVRNFYLLRPLPSRQMMRMPSRSKPPELEEPKIRLSLRPLMIVSLLPPLIDVLRRKRCYDVKDLLMSSKSWGLLIQRFGPFGNCK